MVKKIHYVWFGGNPLPAAVKSCINSWKKNCPDWEIIQWDESNFDINKYIWVKEAIENRKYAFAADFVRLYVLNLYGGAYIDTDVEIIRNIDSSIQGDFVCGIQVPYVVSADDIYNRLSLQTGFLYSEKGHSFVKRAMQLIYNDGNRHFKAADGSLATMPIDIELMSLLIDEYGAQLKDEAQLLKDNIVLHDSTIYASRKSKNKNSYLIHWLDQTWKVNDGIIIILKKFVKRYLFFLYRKQ